MFRRENLIRFSNTHDFNNKPTVNKWFSVAKPFLLSMFIFICDFHFNKIVFLMFAFYFVSNFRLEKSTISQAQIENSGIVHLETWFQISMTEPQFTYLKDVRPGMKNLNIIFIVIEIGMVIMFYKLILCTVLYSRCICIQLFCGIALT